MAEYALALFEAAKKQFGDLFSGLSKLTCEQAGLPIIGYVKTHPSTTALQLAIFLAVAFPAIVTAPTFPVLGLGSLGPVKGGVAAAFQSQFGTPALFSIMQSAAMGGSGVPTVNVVVQGGSAIAAAVLTAVELARKNRERLVVKAKL